ncbi:MAG TPA: NUDIX domain-containing protein [Chitinophagaceae bacterium]|nr:NUDIX domain-containing protein [Chitinophagaceae bacterium]
MAIKKIYVYNKPIILTNEAERYSLENPNTVHYLFLKGNDSSNFRTALTHLEQANSYGVVLENKDVDELLSGFKKAFKNVVAAGGIVLSADDSLLMIYRRGKWDLPKGKLEIGEDIKSCAIREVQEETGIQTLNIRDEVGPSFHLYKEKDEIILKITYWYLMEGFKEEELKPETREQILEAKWVSKEKLDLYLSETFASIKDIVQRGLKK